MPVAAFAMDLKSPHDAATGQISGRRQWAPVVVTKYWGAASPQGLSACATNEVLTDVVIEFMKTSSQGEEYVFERVTLTNAVIGETRRFTSRRPDDGAAPASPLELEDWSFSFQKIEVDDNDGKTSFADDWLVGA